MRLSVDSSDAGYASWLAIKSKSVPVVRVDGEIVQRCITADTKTGYVLVHDEDENGNIRLNAKRNEFLRRQIRGKVEIDLLPKT